MLKKAAPRFQTIDTAVLLCLHNRSTLGHELHPERPFEGSFKLNPLVHTSDPTQTIGKRRQTRNGQIFEKVRVTRHILPFFLRVGKKFIIHKVPAAENLSLSKEIGTIHQFNCSSNLVKKLKYALPPKLVIHHAFFTYSDRGFKLRLIVMRSMRPVSVPSVACSFAPRSSLSLLSVSTSQSQSSFALTLPFDCFKPLPGRRIVGMSRVGAWAVHASNAYTTHTGERTLL